MSEVSNARQVVDRVFELFAEGKLAESIEEYYAEDVVVEHPFGVADPSVWHGKDALREHVANVGQASRESRLRDLEVHETTDPEVLIAQWTTEAVSAVGKELKAANVIVFRVRDGQVVASRDYHDHARMAAANDQLGTLVEALSA